MRKSAFTKTEDFQRFSNVMKRLMAVPKAELDQQVRLHEEQSKAAPTRRGPKPRARSKRKSRP
jgi:hypothetical protein